MQNYNIAGLSESDIRSGAEFIRECLNLDCEQRKSAAELVNHPFLKDAFKC
jgi:serine/threonine-protein kinase SRPK3